MIVSISMVVTPSTSAPRQWLSAASPRGDSHGSSALNIVIHLHHEYDMRVVHHRTTGNSRGYADEDRRRVSDGGTGGFEHHLRELGGGNELREIGLGDVGLATGCRLSDRADHIRHAGADPHSTSSAGAVIRTTSRGRGSPAQRRPFDQIRSLVFAILASQRSQHHRW